MDFSNQLIIKCLLFFDSKKFGGGFLKNVKCCIWDGVVKTKIVDGRAVH